MTLKRRIFRPQRDDGKAMSKNGLNLLRQSKEAYGAELAGMFYFKGQQSGSIVERIVGL